VPSMDGAGDNAALLRYRDPPPGAGRTLPFMPWTTSI
jgi:hypothetical protein